jgi:hypothetical protein
MRPALFALIACVSSGCVHGITTAEFIPARDPQGVRAEIVTQTRRLSGELIAFHDDGLVVVEQRMLRFVPFSAIRTVTFDQVDQTNLGGGRPPNRADRRRFQLLSRYPQGLTPELLDTLLRAYGQTALAGVDR